MLSYLILSYYILYRVKLLNQLYIFCLLCWLLLIIKQTSAKLHSFLHLSFLWILSYNKLYEIFSRSIAKDEFDILFIYLFLFFNYVGILSYARLTISCHFEYYVKFWHLLFLIYLCLFNKISIKCLSNINTSYNNIPTIACSD